MKKKVVAVALAAVGLRLALMTGTGSALVDWIQQQAKDGKLVSATLNVELGSAGEKDEQAAVIPTEMPSPEIVETGQPEGEQEDTEDVTDVPPEPEESQNIIPTTLDGSAIMNHTSFEADPAELMAEGMSLSLPSDGPQILIIHTHTTEAYTPDGTDQYEASGEARTTDTNYNVVRVGNELQAVLESYGLGVIHDTQLYDYPSYTGSYGRSGAAIESYLSQYPTIAVVIDLHRDALGSGDTIYKTMANISGQTSAQVMLVVGTGENGLYHPYWRENLKLALKLQETMQGMYSSLARPINLAQERYNQQYTLGSLILEVGSSGNTLQEALLAVRLFGEAAGPVLAELVQ